MAPRQKRKVSYDDDRFVNFVAQTRYDAMFKDKKIIQDRVFDRPGGDVERIIKERNWENFCYVATRAAVEVVKEFCSNLTQTHDDTVLVRRLPVEFNAARINAYYELPTPSSCEYETFGRTERLLEEVIDFLTDGKGVWKIKQHDRVNFPLSMLNANSKAWHYFICSTLIPTYHHSEVSRERAVLNFCIQNRKRINVGQIIHGNITFMIRNDYGGGLGHPGLIYALCQLSGVEAEDSEEWIQPMKPISKLNLKTYASHEGWRSGVRSSAPSTSRDIPSTSYDIPAPSSPTLHDVMRELTLTRKSFEERFDKFDTRLDSMDSRIAGLERRHDHDCEYWQRHSSYESAFHDAQVRQMRGESDVIFPEYPQYTQYQPDPPAGIDPEDLDWNFDL